VDSIAVSDRIQVSEEAVSGLTLAVNHYRIRSAKDLERKRGLKRFSSSNAFWRDGYRVDNSSRPGDFELLADRCEVRDPWVAARLAARRTNPLQRRADQALARCTPLAAASGARPRTRSELQHLTRKQLEGQLTAEMRRADCATEELARKDAQRALVANEMHNEAALVTKELRNMKAKLEVLREFNGRVKNALSAWPRIGAKVSALNVLTRPLESALQRHTELTRRITLVPTGGSRGGGGGRAANFAVERQRSLDRWQGGARSGGKDRGWGRGGGGDRGDGKTGGGGRGGNKGGGADPSPAVPSKVELGSSRRGYE
jgi:hypothetical protein